MMGHGGQQPITKSGATGLIERLGERVTRRAEPRLGIALAGVGVAMVVVGVVVWGGDAAGGSGDGDSNQVLGSLLSLAVIAAGYLLIVRFRHGPLAAAGVAAAALGVPVLMAFLTFDASSDPGSELLFAMPFSVDAIVLLSLAAWLATYVWVPVASGRVFFLALSVFALWLYALEKVEEGAAAYVVTLPYSSIVVSVGSAFDEESVTFDPSSLGVMSLVVGIAYYLAAMFLDRRGYRGMAMPFVGAGLAASAVGIVHLASDLEAIGTGLVLIAMGSVLGTYGAMRGRRVTTWAWSGAAGLGVLVILVELFRDTVSGFGVTAIVLGAGVVLIGHLVADGFAEPSEMTPGPSRFTWQRTGPTSGWADPPTPPGSGPWGPPGPSPAGPPPLPSAPPMPEAAANPAVPPAPTEPPWPPSQPAPPSPPTFPTIPTPPSSPASPSAPTAPTNPPASPAPPAGPEPGAPESPQL
jgi:hypothetical protein